MINVVKFCVLCFHSVLSNPFEFRMKEKQPTHGERKKKPTQKLSFYSFFFAFPFRFIKSSDAQENPADFSFPSKRETSSSA